LIASIVDAGSASGVTTGAIDTTGANFLVVAAASSFGGTGATLTDSKGNAWTPLTPQGIVNGRSRLYYCLSPIVGSGHTFSYTGSEIYPSIAVQAWGGMPSAAFVAEAGASTTSETTLATGDIVPGGNNRLFIAAVTGQGSTASIDSDFTISDSLPFVFAESYQIGLAYYIQGTGATLNPAWTLNVTEPMAVTGACFSHS
jgi:hypothetical protein